MTAYNILVKKGCKMDFSKFCETKIDKNETKINREEIKHKAQKANLPTEDELKTKLSQYQNMNSEQLMNELMKQKSSFSAEKIDTLKSTLSPMLDNSQRNKLDEILKMLK